MPFKPIFVHPLKPKLITQNPGMASVTVSHPHSQSCHLHVLHVSLSQTA